MNTQKVYRSVLPGAIVFLAIFMAFFIVECGGGDGGGSGGNDPNDPPPGDTNTVEFPLGGVADDIELTAGQTKSINFVGEVPTSVQPYNTITLNLQNILDNGYVEIAGLGKGKLRDLFAKATSVREAAAAYQWQVSLRFATSENVDTVCEDGYLYGPYTASGTEKPDVFNPETASAEPATVDLVNFGEFAMCIQISSPIDMTASISDISVDVTTCDEDPADFAGEWSGTYTCTNQGCDDEIDVPVTLTVTQDGHSAKYTDSLGASFSGTVCGNAFKFNGGISGEYGYTEKGILTLNNDGTASKQASFVSEDGSCSGNCSDTLTRQ